MCYCPYCYERYGAAVILIDLKDSELYAVCPLCASSHAHELQEP